MHREHERTPTLHEVQRWMAAAIVGGTPPELLPFTGTRSLSNVADCSDQSCPEPETRAAGLAVYADGYPARIHEALEEQFPALAHIVGDGAFAQLVRRYITAVPLRSYNLNDAGAGLPLFLRADELTTTLPFLPDLAHLESLICRAFHAHDAAVLDPASVAQWTPEQWERAVVCFQPWAAVLRSDWPVREIWDCRDTPIEAIDIDLNQRPQCVLVRRAGDAVVCESVDGGEGDALARLLDGEALGGVIAAIADRGHDPAVVSTWFAHWTALRAVTGLRPA